MIELCDLGAVELRRMIGVKDISPVDLLDSCIARTEAVDGAVNAMVARDFERARKAAQAAERAVMTGEELGALHGLPVGVNTGMCAVVLAGRKVTGAKCVDCI